MKTKALISFAVTAKLICVFVFAYAKTRFSHDTAHIMLFCIFIPWLWYMYHFLSEYNLQSSVIIFNCIIGAGDLITDVISANLPGDSIAVDIENIHGMF